VTPTVGTDVWYARHTTPTGGVVLVGVAGPGFPDGTVVDLPGPPAHPAGWLAEAHVQDAGHVPVLVQVSPELADGSPHLWFVLGPAGTGDDVDLVAFSTTALADGRVVGTDDLAAAGVTWADQVAAVRWSPSSGLVSQVYVAPRARRRRVGTRVVVTADAVRVALGWAPLVGDGRMTDLGDAWLSAQSGVWRARVPAGGERPPPMTPAEEAVGVPARQLVRDEPGTSGGTDRVVHRR
jgi:GNAT superfamily N-acetyltransferase